VLRLPIVSVALAFSLWSISGAALSIPAQVIGPGQSVVTAISLSSSGQPVSALQFDLVWDQPLGVSVAAGSSIGASSKMLYSHTTSQGNLRCVIAGLNQVPLADGDVLRLFLTLPPNASPATAHITTANVVAAAPNGSPAAVDPASADIQLSSQSSQQFLQPEGVLNAASLLPGPISPGEIITLLGLMPASPEVLINGVSAPITYTGAFQVNAIVPFGLDTTVPSMLEFRAANQSVTLILPVATAAPAIFSQAGSGIGPGAILNEDFSLNSYSMPARAGSVIMIYATGMGPLESPPVDGLPVAAAVPVGLPVAAQIGRLPAQVVYAGSAPGLVAGVMQINVLVPNDLPPNPETPISLTVGSVTTPPGITFAVQ
jgi:uncharacterized protein (TIGR03437 family)